VLFSTWRNSIEIQAPLIIRKRTCQQGSAKSHDSIELKNRDTLEKIDHLYEAERPRNMAGRTDRPRGGMERDNEQERLAGWNKTLAGRGLGWDGFLVVPRSSVAQYNLPTWTPPGPPELFLLEMNLLNVDTFFSVPS
jgi:hypothetical protein